ncbi:MAG: zeta toxin family protein [Acidiferrobacteraceae bacterium]
MYLYAPEGENVADAQAPAPSALDTFATDAMSAIEHTSEMRAATALVGGRGSSHVPFNPYDPMAEQSVRLSEQDYKNSDWYVPGKYFNGMTNIQAQSIHEAHQESVNAAEGAEAHPIAGFAGGSAGSATDGLYYIPFLDALKGVGVLGKSVAELGEFAEGTLKTGVQFGALSAAEQGYKQAKADIEGHPAQGGSALSILEGFAGGLLGGAVGEFAHRFHVPYHARVQAVQTALDQIAGGKPVDVSDVIHIKPDLSAERDDNSGISIAHNPDLSPEETAIQTKFSNTLRADPAELAHQYTEQFGRTVNTDNARELSPDYNKSHAARTAMSNAVHEPASALAKEVYTRLLGEPVAPGKDAEVLFTAGGTGAGKTSALAHAGIDTSRADIVYDSNMNNYASAKAKIDAALRSGRTARIVMVYRDPADAMENGVLPRATRTGRVVNVDAHAATHSQMYDTLDRLQKAYSGDDRVKFKFIDNTHGKGRSALTEFDKLPQHTYNEVRDKSIASVEKAYAEGKITAPIRDQTIRPGIQRVAAATAPGTLRPDGSGDDRVVKQRGAKDVTPSFAPVGPPMLSEEEELADPFKPGVPLPQDQVEPAAPEGTKFSPANQRVFEHESESASHDGELGNAYLEALKCRSAA